MDGSETRRNETAVGFLKRIQLLFVAAAVAAVAAFVWAIPFSHSLRLRLCLVVSLYFLLFASLFSDFVFRFHFTRNSQMNFAWKQKSHAKRAKCRRKRQREAKEGRVRRYGAFAWESVFHFWYFFAGKLKWDLFITFSILNLCSLSLLRSSQRYLHSSPSIHSASLEKVSTIEWQIHMYICIVYMYLYLPVCLSVCMCTYLCS